MVFSVSPVEEEPTPLYDARQDEESYVQDFTCDDSEETSRSRVQTNAPTPLSSCLFPLLPLAYYFPPHEQSIRSTGVRRSFHQHDIFRTYSSEIKFRSRDTSSEYSEFCKLGRCKAWSQDSTRGISSEAAAPLIRKSSSQLSLTSLRKMIDNPLEDMEGEVLDHTRNSPSALVIS